ncbi:MAG: GTPase HflX [Haemophilus parainfluenzae]|nr:GTPase HflX [Haemophilus parainfluenzae]
MNDFINLSAVENSPEISTALSSSKTGDNSQSAKDKAVVVHVFFSQNKNIEDLQEFQLLAESANVEILQIITTSIFAQRARSHEGKLQVELAQLKHLSTRLVRRKTGLDQQKGAVGLRGPGETQLETDRRLIKVRIAQLQNRLEKVEKQRNQNRQTRQKADIPTISLVGYTNAGKSTLFNFITQANVYAADQLFATLDPTLRRLQIQDVGTAILADTVGFVRGEGLDLLLEAIKVRLKNEILSFTLTLLPQEGKIRHALYQLDSIRHEQISDEGEFILNVQIDKVEWLKLCKQFPKLSEIIY